MKKCSKCKETKDLSLFPVDRHSSKGYRSDCKACHAKNYHDKKISNDTVNKRRKFREQNLDRYRKQALNWYYNNKDKSKDSRLKRVYGISLEEHNQILINQNHRCAICQTDKPEGTGNQFNVDHDHKTGKVRGLLCWNCNTFIGYAKENIKSLKSAIDYLTKHSL